MDHNVLHDTQKWAKANGMNVSLVESVIDSLEMPDFITLAEALDAKAYDTISQLYNKAHASIMESYDYFRGETINESIGQTMSKDEFHKHMIKTMPYDQLCEAYHQLPGSSWSVDNLSLAHLQTLVYEGLGSFTTSTNNPASQFNKPAGAKPSTVTPTGPTPTGAPNDAMNTTEMMPAELMQKQQQLTALQPGEQVQMAGDMAASPMDIQGIDVDDQDPSNTHVVVQDPTNPNELNVVGIEDIEMMQEEDEEQDRLLKLAGM